METGPLTGRLGLSKGGQSAHREAGPLTESLASHSKAVPHWEAGPLTGRPGLSQGGLASNREARFLTGRPGLSQGGQASHREARPLTVCFIPC